MNYFSNAVNHCEKEKVVEVKIEEMDGHARVSVFNTGMPIPEDSLPHLWEKFYKVDKARTREYGGSGIGLSIVKAIMESMNQMCIRDSISGLHLTISAVDIIKKR